MTAAQLIEALSSLPADAVVLIDSGEELSLVVGLDYVAAQGPGALSEIILSPSMVE